MQIFRLEALSGPLSPARFRLFGSESQLLARFEERREGGILHFTKLRTVMPLLLHVEWIPSRTHLLLEREKGLWVPYLYWVKSSHGKTIWCFRRESMLFGELKWRVFDPYANEVAGVRSSNPLIVGPQRAKITDSAQQIQATFTWKNWSFWKGFREAQIEILSAPDPWTEMATIAAVIRGLELQQR
jgi:hypothetical protein